MKMFNVEVTVKFIIPDVCVEDDEDFSLVDMIEELIDNEGIYELIDEDDLEVVDAQRIG